MLLENLTFFQKGHWNVFSRPLSCPSPFHVATQLKNRDGVNWTRCDQKRSMIHHDSMALDWWQLIRCFFYRFAKTVFQVISLLHIFTVQSSDVFACKSASASVRLLPRKIARVSLQRLLGNQFAQVTPETFSHRFKPTSFLNMRNSTAQTMRMHRWDSESRPNMTSPGGERGLWQLPPAARLEMLRPLDFESMGFQKHHLNEEN